MQKKISLRKIALKYSPRTAVSLSREARFKLLTIHVRWFRLQIMNSKRDAIEMIEKLPEDSSTSDIMAELYFKSKIEKGRMDIREGRVLTQEEVEKKMSVWAKSIGQK